MYKFNFNENDKMMDILGYLRGFARSPGRMMWLYGGFLGEWLFNAINKHEKH